MHRLRLLIIVIGVFLSGLSYAEVEISDDGGSIHPGMVLVEPTNIIRTSENGEYSLKPYRDRRRRWGVTVSADYSTYAPVNYQPDFAPASALFKDVYTTPEMPMISLTLVVKRNLSYGSLGGELSAGIYKNDSDDTTLSDSTLQLTPLRVGAIFFLDTLSPEPYIVPYAAAGAYMMIYKEELAGTSKNGNTQPAPYFHAGAQFQLDWLDRKTARAGYEDSGVESSYLLVELRKQMASSAESDPNFSDDITVAAGVRVEF